MGIFVSFMSRQSALISICQLLTLKALKFTLCLSATVINALTAHQLFFHAKSCVM